MEDLAMYLLDIANNAIRAMASLIEIVLINSEKRDLLLLSVKDNGEGMDDQMVEKVQDPFFTTRTTRKVGLGIPLFKQGALMANGSFKLESTPHQGTLIEASYQRSHLDTPPLGDIAESLVTIIQAGEAQTIRFHYEDDARVFDLDTDQVKEILEGVSILTPEVLLWLKTYIKEGIGQ